MKKNIIILIPLVWSYRNFFLTGIINELDKKYNVYLAVPSQIKNNFKNLSWDDNKIIFLTPPVKSKLQNYLFKLIKKIHSKKHPTETEIIFSNFHSHRNLKSKLKEFLMFGLFVNIFSINLCFNALKKLESFFFINANSSTLEKSLDLINPLFILSTANVVDFEWAIFKLAQHKKIKTFCHILSFDNLTSRGYLPIENFDFYFVWNEKMMNELKVLYNINDDKILVSGTPQFDFHLKKEYVYSEFETKQKIDLDLDDNYLLYCANHFNITPDEPSLFKFIYHEIKLLYPKLKFVLRLHPMDNYDRWTLILNQLPDVILSIPWKHDSENLLSWGEPDLNEIVLFSNLLRYSSVMLNIASTVSIDASFTNTPVICLGFHPIDKKESNYYRDLHYSDHFRDIIKFGFSPLALSLNQLLVNLDLQLNNRELYSKERLKLKNYYFCSDYSSSSEKILNKLLKYD